MKPNTVAAAIAGIAAAAAMLAPTPASAEVRTFQDAKGDVAHGVDVWSVKVTNRKLVRVDIQHDNLVRSFRSGASAAVFLDTDRDRPGPEFVLGSGLFHGTDYQLSKARRWKAVGAPLTCNHALSLDYAADVTHLRFGRKCLGNPEDVRVAVKAAGERRNGDIVVDWLGGRRQLTAWVGRG
jgi:hypothetical protein